MPVNNFSIVSYFLRPLMLFFLPKHRNNFRKKLLDYIYGFKDSNSACGFTLKYLLTHTFGALKIWTYRVNFSVRKSMHLDQW